MKKILCSLVLMGGLATGLAQSVVWMDDFNDEDISDWTLIDADMDGNNWGDSFVVTDGSNNAITPVSLISRSWIQTPLTPDNWAISPAIDLSNASGTISVEYITQVPAFDWDEEHYSLYVSTSNDPEDLEASTVQMSETLGDAGNTGAPVQKSFDISAFAGESEVYIAFRHHDVTDMDFISIDDVTVVAETLSTTDLNAADKASVNLYPNPAKDIVHIALGNSMNAQTVSVTLTDVNGKQVLNTKYIEELNVSHLPSGLYIMTIVDGATTTTKKFIKK